MCQQCTAHDFAQLVPPDRIDDHGQLAPHRIERKRRLVDAVVGHREHRAAGMAEKAGFDMSNETARFVDAIADFQHGVREFFSLCRLVAPALPSGLQHQRALVLPHGQAAVLMSLRVVVMVVGIGRAMGIGRAADMGLIVGLTVDLTVGLIVAVIVFTATAMIVMVVAAA